MKKPLKKNATIIVFEQNIYNPMYQTLFHDALIDEDVFLVVENNYPNQLFYRGLRKYWDKLYRFPFKSLLECLFAGYYLLPQKVNNLRENYEHIRVLFHNASLCGPHYPECILSSLKKKNVSLNLIYLDPIGRPFVSDYADFLREKNLFDKVFTFDFDDAVKYGLEKCDTPYSKIQVPASGVKQDLYCITSGTARAYATYKVFQNAHENNVSVLFDLVRCNDLKDFYRNDPGAVFHDCVFSYETVLKSICESSCILDIMSPGQSGLSIRPYEAVVYNKKLLTNNKNIVSFKYYDPQYMQYFSNPDEIDWDWVKTKDTPDYGYQGDFSPRYLLEKL